MVDTNGRDCPALANRRLERGTQIRVSCVSTSPSPGDRPPPLTYLWTLKSPVVLPNISKAPIVAPGPLEFQVVPPSVE